LRALNIHALTNGTIFEDDGAGIGCLVARTRSDINELSLQVLGQFRIRSRSSRHLHAYLSGRRRPLSAELKSMES
jgi:hypothetical protein